VLLPSWRHAAVLAFAICSAYVAFSEAVRSSVVEDKTPDFLALVEPLKADLPALGIAPDELIGYQDDHSRKPDGSGRYLYLTRLCLAPLRLEFSTDHEWLLVVRIEGPLRDLDKSGLERVKEYFGMTLYRRRADAKSAPRPGASGRGG
jgi:hypothetical protein